MLTFALVVRLLVQLALGLAQQGGDIQLPGQQAGDPQQGGDVIDVAVDAVPDARILDLDGQIVAGQRQGAVHLSDRGGGDGVEVELLELRLPAPAPAPVQGGLQLHLRHRPGVSPQPRQDVGKFGREHFARVHGDQLADLHRRAAQLGQLFGDPYRIGGRQQQVADGRSLALAELTRALGQHPAGHARGQPAEAGQPGESPAGDGHAAWG